MTRDTGASIHATAVLAGDRAILIRGPSGSGKSRLAFDLILAGRAGVISPTALIGDDRVYLDRQQGAVRVRGATELAGKIEVRGLGIRSTVSVPEGNVGLVVDLAAGDAERLPPPEAFVTNLLGAEIPRIPVAAEHAPLPLVLAFLTTT